MSVGERESEMSAFLKSLHENVASDDDEDESLDVVEKELATLEVQSFPLLFLSFICLIVFFLTKT